MSSDIVKRIDYLSSLYVLNPSNKLEKKDDREKKKKRDNEAKSRKNRSDVKGDEHLVDRKA